MPRAQVSEPTARTGAPVKLDQVHTLVVLPNAEEHIGTLLHLLDDAAERTVAGLRWVSNDPPTLEEGRCVGGKGKAKR